jgi:GNAT superfamily N-acetyltransferase
MDFNAVTDADVIKYLVANQHEMNAEGITESEIHAKIAEGKVVVERETQGRGVALVEVEDRKGWVNTPGANLWLLWIDPAFRGQRIGTEFVKAILTKHAKTYFATVHCHGPHRAMFFGRLGFRVVKRHDGVREMEQWR